MRKIAFADADQVIAHDPAFMLQPLIDADCDLCGEVLSAGKNWRANHCGEARVNQHLPADDHKDTMLFRIAARLVHAIKFAAFHGLKAARALYKDTESNAFLLFIQCLVFEDVRCFGIQAVRGSIQAFEVALHGRTPCLLP